MPWGRKEGGLPLPHSTDSTQVALQPRGGQGPRKAHDMAILGLPARTQGWASRHSLCPCAGIQPCVPCSPQPSATTEPPGLNTARFMIQNMGPHPGIGVTQSSERLQAPRPRLCVHRSRENSSGNPPATPCHQYTYPNTFHGFVDFSMPLLRLHAHRQS